MTRANRGECWPTAGVLPPTVRYLLLGRDGRTLHRLRAVDAERILRLCPEVIDRLRHEPGACACCVRWLRALGLTGASRAQIAEFIGMATSDLAVLMGGGEVWCSRLQVLRARAACEARSITPADLGVHRESLGRAA